MASQASSSSGQKTQSQQSTDPVTASHTQEQSLSRQEQHQATENRTLAEFMLMLDDYEPLARLDFSAYSLFLLTSSIILQIPNEVTDYYLQRVGVECQDIRL